ncbi:MAG: CBS domain-containing protein [Acidimicrobiia bacterium]|nr:CBS domain-containing protein [Acidimicrobiia bacterium]
MPETAISDHPVSTIASKYVITVESNASLRTVVEHIIEGRVSLVVVDDSGSVVGVVSEHDVLQAIHDGADIDEVWAADIMSTDVVTAHGDETIAEVAHRMLENRLRHVLVQGDEGGVVSIRDILDALLS